MDAFIDNYPPDNLEKQFDFAESLFQQGDFFRAITEYKRFIFFYPEDDLVEDSFFRIGESYFRAGRWEGCSAGRS